MVDAAELAGEGSPFTEYERFVRQSRAIVTINKHNIGSIAEFIGGAVDYSGPEPLLIDTRGHGSSWQAQIGWTVSWDGEQLTNQNGMLAEGEGWKPVEAKTDEPATNGT